MASQVVESRDRRIGKSIAMAHSCEIYKFANEKETYKVQSETQADRFYIVKFMNDTPVFCTCKDWELRSQKNPEHLCKHMRAVVLADTYNLIKEEPAEEQQEELTKIELEYETDQYDF